MPDGAALARNAADALLGQRMAARLGEAERMNAYNRALQRSLAANEGVMAARRAVAQDNQWQQVLDGIRLPEASSLGGMTHLSGSLWQSGENGLSKEAAAQLLVALGGVNRSLLASSEGFKVQRVGEMAKVFGTRKANELLGLPKNFRISAISNERLLAAKGFDPNLARGLARASGPLAFAAPVVEIAADTASYSRGELAGDAFAANATNSAVGFGFSAVATAGLVAGTAWIAPGLVAAAPVLVTAGAVVGAGYLFGAVYDSLLKDRVDFAVRSRFESSLSTQDD